MTGVARLFAAEVEMEASGKTVFIVLILTDFVKSLAFERCWDLLSGLTVNIITDCGGEVTSVACSGNMIVTAARNSTVRVIDMRMNRVLQRLRGSHNVSRNFIRASFGPGNGNVMCGSEDGVLHIWDQASGDRVDKITASASPVYAGAWSAAQGILACACHDGTVPLWGPRQRFDNIASPNSPAQT
jgi:WD40 repeat protein